MENIEQLKADNAKLTERLNNAAKFFREQKATIEKLTEEAKDKDVEIANQKDALESCYKQLHDLEMMTDSLNKENEELKRKPQEEVIDTKKWNALVTEKENLNEQLNEYELKLQASEKSYEELKELHDGDLKRYNELEDNYEGLQNNYKELKEMYDNEINHFNKEQSEYENSITLLEEDNIKLGKDVHDLEAYIEKTGKEHEQVINDLKKENKEAEEQFNKILDSIELELNNVKKENDKLKNDNFELEADYQALANMHEKLQHRVDAYDNKANALESIKEIILNVFPETKKVEKQQPVRNDGFDARANNIGI